MIFRAFKRSSCKTNSEGMEIDGNNDITTLGNDIEVNEETSTALGNANEKEAEN